MRRMLGILAIIGLVSAGAAATSPLADAASQQGTPVATPSTVAPGEAFSVSGPGDCIDRTSLVIAIPGLGLSETLPSGLTDVAWEVQFTAPADAVAGDYPITVDFNECSYDVGSVTVAITDAISLVKTVGTTPGVCATTATLTVEAGTTVYYCYTVTNNTQFKLPVHSLTDDKLGTILTSAAYDLIPGASINTVTLGKTVSTTIKATTKNTATWTAYTEPGVPFSATASATVTVSAKPAVGAEATPAFTG